MKRLMLFLPLVIFVLLALLFWRGLSLDPDELPSALVGKPLPEFELPRLDNPEQTITRQDIIGKPFLLNVWGSWCVSCRYEHPYLIKLAEQGVPIYGVAYKDLPENAQKWLDDLGDPYEANIVDLEGTLGIDLGVSGAPETYVVDADGIIRHKHVGVLNEQVWAQEVAPALFGQAPAEANP
jgi:cytochrome c biogenesis protein CcmG/thiol:disulfide interchange protein DsbE